MSLASTRPSTSVTPATSSSASRAGRRSSRTGKPVHKPQRLYMRRQIRGLRRRCRQRCRRRLTRARTHVYANRTSTQPGSVRLTFPLPNLFFLRPLITCSLPTGIDRENRHGEPLIFHDTGRYAELMASTKDERRPDRLSLNYDWAHSNQRDKRTPSLVSFVGQSGAGKSTLINLLIAFKGGANKTQLPSPVVGMTGKDLPTSEDVHLYSDPYTYFLDNPMLYADCEGLDGGEREPVNSRFRRAKLEHHDENGINDDYNGSARYSSVRELMWADSPERRSRQFAVTYLYPRLLFTFSDTIVFVLKNPRYEP